MVDPPAKIGKFVASYLCAVQVFLTVNKFTPESNRRTTMYMYNVVLFEV